jgi:hypothetical protein
VKALPPETKAVPEAKAPEPKPAPSEPAVAAAAPAPATPPPAPRTEENADAAIHRLLARYRTALEARDIGGLKSIWPALAGRQEEALVNEFQHARSISVGLDAVDIRPTATGATVSCQRTYVVMTDDGRTLRTVTTMVMTLARRDNNWAIQGIRHEVAR